jgi:PPE-repeat protein
MYTGPGSGSLLAAAAAWDGLAAELHLTAASYASVIAGLTTGPWSGPAAASMAAAAAPYVAWLNGSAAQAEEAASQARAAAASYQQAYAATVPPALVAANRSRLLTLTARNTFGQYTAAIAAIEAQYAQMWAQDLAAMYGYAGSSASATTLMPFTNPPQTTDPGGPANQAAAAGQAAGTSAGTAQSAVSSVPQAFSVVPSTLQGLAAGTPAQGISGTTALNVISDLIAIFLDVPADLTTFFLDVPANALSVVGFPLDVIGAGTGLHTDDIVSGWAGEQPWPLSGDQPPTDFKAIITGPIEPAATSSAALQPAAGLGEANTVGALTVPPTWTIATPAVQPIAVTLPALPATAVGAAVAEAAGEAAEVGSGSTLGEMAAAGLAGRAVAGTLAGGAGKSGGAATAGGRVRAGAPGTSEGAAPVAGDATSHDKPRSVVTGVAAELREFAKLRDEGILTDEEYTEQKNRLLGR